jgi:hypothetical protein
MMYFEFDAAAGDRSRHRHPLAGSPHGNGRNAGTEGAPVTKTGLAARLLIYYSFTA